MKAVEYLKEVKDRILRDNEDLKERTKLVAPKTIVDQVERENDKITTRITKKIDGVINYIRKSLSTRLK